MLELRRSGNNVRITTGCMPQAVRGPDLDLFSCVFRDAKVRNDKISLALTCGEPSAALKTRDFGVVDLESLSVGPVSTFAILKMTLQSV